MLRTLVIDQDREHAERAKEVEEATKLGTPRPATATTRLAGMPSQVALTPSRLPPSLPIAGKKAPRRKTDLPKPTELMKAREVPLELDKNLNKTVIVNPGAGTGQNQPGFYCDVCRRTHKDSVAYLDHINGRSRKRNSFGFWPGHC